MLNSFDFYGAKQLIGIKSTIYKYPVSWSHGIPWGEFDWTQILAPGDEEACIHFVRNETERELLRSKFTDHSIIEIGLPIVYVNTQIKYAPIERLFVPGHGVQGLEVGNNDIVDLVRLTKLRRCDGVLLPSSEYSRHFGNKSDVTCIDGISILRGAGINCSFSLTRIVSILRMTGTIVTNILGSHVYYAAAHQVEIDFLRDELEWYSEEDIARIVPKYPIEYQRSVRSYLWEKSSKLDQLDKLLSLDISERYVFARKQIGYQHKTNIPKFLRDHVKGLDILKYNFYYTSKRIINKIKQR